MASHTRSLLSRSIEDYLKAILELQSEGVPAQTSAIAESLAVAPPSVSGMLKRLAEVDARLAAQRAYWNHPPRNAVHRAPT